MSEEQEDYLTDALEMIGVVQPKKIETQISGWIPVFDFVVDFYQDPITAIVFGRRWQYCGMEDGVCRASLSKLAKDLHLDEATVMRHTEKLVKDGFLVDKTPTRRNRPHVYVDGGKVTMKTALNAHIAHSNTSIAQSNVGIAQSQLIKQDKTNIKQDAQLSEQDLAGVNKKVDAILGITEWAGAKREARVSAIQSYLGETFHRNTETKEWLKFAKFIDDKQQNSGEDVKVFVAWLLGQKSYDPQFWPVSKMMEFWPSAFVSVQSSHNVEIDSDGIPETY